MFQAVDKSLDDVLVNVHQDYVNMVLSIHDEVDLVMDKRLMEGISWSLTKEAECKDIYDRFGFRYVNIFFDIEYNKDNGSFAVNSDFNVYKERAKEIELRLDDKVIESSEVDQVGKIVVYLKEVDEGKLAELSKLADGECRLFLDLGRGGSYEYDRRVALDKVLLGKFVYNVIME
jgi:hypothetical protein